jgi:hypothetical protein
MCCLSLRQLAVREPDADPIRMGFGRRLIEETLPFQLEIRLEFGKSDVRCSRSMLPSSTSTGGASRP